MCRKWLNFLLPLWGSLRLGLGLTFSWVRLAALAAVFAVVELGLSALDVELWALDTELSVLVADLAISEAELCFVVSVN